MSAACTCTNLKSTDQAKEDTHALVNWIQWSGKYDYHFTVLLPGRMLGEVTCCDFPPFLSNLLSRKFDHLSCDHLNN